MSIHTVVFLIENHKNFKNHYNTTSNGARMALSVH
jgi:hypothetical protein